MVGSRYEQNKRWMYESGSVRGALNAKLARFKASMRKKTAIPISITAPDLMRLWEMQGGCCAVSGVPLRLSDGSGVSHPDSLTIGRRDVSKAYTPDNIRLITQQAAYAMNAWGEERLVEFCLSVVRANGYETSQRQ